MLGSSRVSSVSLWKVSWSGVLGVVCVAGVRTGVSISMTGNSASSKKDVFVHV